MESDKRIKIEGEGYLINNDLNKQFPVKFEAEQTYSGYIGGRLSEFKEEDIPSLSMLEDWRYNFSLIGETKNREKVIIEDIHVSRIRHPGATLDVKFLARKIEASYETISIKDQFWIQYGIINLDLRHVLRGQIETDIGKITFSKLKNHEEVIEEMKIFKTPLVSGFINVTNVNIEKFNSFDSYFKTVDKTIEKVLELLSLAKSTYLTPCLIRICTKNQNSRFQEKYKLKRLIMWYSKTKAPVIGQPLIEDLEDLYSFVSNTLPKYTDDLKGDFDLGIAFEWYLESLSYGVVQRKYLLACTCLELLKDRYNKMIGNEFIIRPKKLFDKKGYKYLKNKTSEMLKEIGINEDSTEHENIKKEIDKNLIGINRTSFKSSLLRLLNDLHIIYNDLFRDINIIPKIRNQITHRGIQEMDSKELIDVYKRLICLIQRIFLALLEYDGYFLDRNDGYGRKKFTNFISSEFARTTEEISRGGS